MTVLSTRISESSQSLFHRQVALLLNGSLQIPVTSLPAVNVMVGDTVVSWTLQVSCKTPGSTVPSPVIRVSPFHISGLPNSVGKEVWIYHPGMAH